MAAVTDKNTGMIVPGQRWMSDAEPELGIGMVVEADERSVVIAFAGADETRRYALKTAPLRRVRFAVGDVIADSEGDGERLSIDGVDEQDGLVVYRCGERRLVETRVSDRATLTGPRERILAARVDSLASFDLRLETLARLHALRKSKLRGFVGPRVELLPHQFFIASEVTSRRRPRVLLADETGLGKTIEACLILNRLLLTGRAARMLILVPDSLVHQWLVELRRRFNLRFAIFDEQRCQAVESADPAAPSESGVNPFESEQLVLAGISLLADSRRRSVQAADAAWDVVVVDEAHHLVWREGEAGNAYRAVAAVAAGCGGLLLLSATPEQLGEESHFARLGLLDPNRYQDFARWRAEARRYREIARAADGLLRDRTPTEEELPGLAKVLDVAPEEVRRRGHDAAGRRRLIDELIDRHGPGRVMFRNTRAAMTSFPKREAHLRRYPPTDDDSGLLARIAAEIETDLAASTAAVSSNSSASADVSSDDPRVDCILDLLAEDARRKLLVICRSADKAQALKAAIEARVKVDIALFHEGLTLVQRDRNAAWFASDGGARVLVCSEIGSEGRNFQHVQHLVMFDLPLDPDLVEQRIGRLDRIGQRGNVHISVPFVAATGLEVLARWHHEGVGALERSTLTALPLLERFGPHVRSLALHAAHAAWGETEKALDQTIADTAAAARELAERVHAGRDRLLELASLRREIADPLIAAIGAADEDTALEDYFLRLLESVHIYAEEIGARTYRLNPDAMHSTEFPSLEQGETAVTFDRETALVREDFELASGDHPLLCDAMELLLASERGNASFALARGDAGTKPRLILEAVFVLEPVAPPRLHVDRFLPPTPVRVAVDQSGADLSASNELPVAGELAEDRTGWLESHLSTLRPWLSKMVASAEQLADASAERLRETAVGELRESLGAELTRLRALARMNDHVRSEEIDDVAEELVAVEHHVERSRLRMDSARLVWQGPALMVDGGQAYLR